MQISDLARTLSAAAAPLTTSDKRTTLEWASQLSTMNESAKLATRLHLLTLLFEVRAYYDILLMIFYPPFHQTNNINHKPNCKLNLFDQSLHFMVNVSSNIH